MIRRFFPIQDSTITNAYDEYFHERKEEANLGGSDILETFVLYNRDAEGEYELSRILIKFDMADLVAQIKSSAVLVGATYYLKLYNVAHAETLPRNFTLRLYKLTQEWTEGNGLDFEQLGDTGGVSWLAHDTIPDGDPRPTTNDWLVPGGDYDDTDVKSCTFLVGDEDLSVDITDWVQSWVDTVNPEVHYGILIKFSDQEETSGAMNEYTKKFFARQSQYFYKRPILEVLYEDGTSTDNDGSRKEFVLNSVLYNTPTNYLYYHNKPRGFLEDVPGYTEDDGVNPAEPQLAVNLYDEDDNEIVSGLLAEWVSTGVYRVAANILEGYLFATAHDKWFREEDAVNPIYTGTIIIHCPNGGSAEVFEDTKTKLTVRELKPFYLNEEVVKFKVDAVDLHWNPNVYVSYYNDGRNQKTKLVNTYYKVIRKIDNLVVVEYSCLGDSGVDYSKLYYNENYNYFTFYCDILEPGYMYEVRFMSVINGEYWEHPEAFKFRIEDPKKFRF